MKIFHWKFFFMSFLIFYTVSIYTFVILKEKNVHVSKSLKILNEKIQTNVHTWNVLSFKPN